MVNLQNKLQNGIGFVLSWSLYKGTIRYPNLRLVMGTNE